MPEFRLAVVDDATPVNKYQGRSAEKEKIGYGTPVGENCGIPPKITLNTTMVTMGLRMIHRGPSDECPCELCRDDAPVYAQGRVLEPLDDGTFKGGAIAGLLFCLGVLMVACVALIAWAS